MSPSKLTLRDFLCLPFTVPMPRPLTPLPQPLPGLLLLDVTALTSLPSRGVTGAMPLLESPVELAGLSVRVEFANGLRGGNETSVELGGIAIMGVRLVLRGRIPPAALRLDCADDFRGCGTFGFVGESSTIGEGVGIRVLLRFRWCTGGSSSFAWGRDVTLNAGGGVRRAMGTGARPRELGWVSVSSSLSSSEDDEDSSSESVCSTTRFERTGMLKGRRAGVGAGSAIGGANRGNVGDVSSASPSFEMSRMPPPSRLIRSVSRSLVSAAVGAGRARPSLEDLRRKWFAGVIVPVLSRLIPP